MIEQMRYVHERPLGFEKENRLVLTLRGRNIAKNVATIRNELRNLPHVLDVTHMLYHAPGTDHGMLLMDVEKTDGVFEQTPMHALHVGLNFTQALNIEMVQGRAFAEDFATEAMRSVLVNEAMVRKMGWSSPLGKRFDVGGGTMLNVIGVTRDFHYASLHNLVGPLVMLPIGGGLGPVPLSQIQFVNVTFIVALSGVNVSETLRAIGNVVAKFDPRLDFEPVFLDDRLNQLYKTETNLMRLTGVFAGVCILIAALGIFGLAAFTTEQRTKEIGVRKVLGASDVQILAMLTRPLLWLVLIAALPASFAGYHAIDRWLQRFAYRTEIDVLTFVVATLVVCGVALATVATQSLRTTRANPADALRYE
jgi:putative ABC transport system permease protein